MNEEIKDEICLCTINGYSKKVLKTFDTYEDLIKWAKEQTSEISVNDLVEVTDTGFCYKHISNEVLVEFYQSLEIDIHKYTEIINNLNHKSLGYTSNIYRIDKKDCTFRVVTQIGDKYVIEAVKGDDLIHYIDGYYVVGKKGVKKVYD